MKEPISPAERKTSRSDRQRSCENDVVRYMCVRVCVLLMSVSQTVGEASWGDEWAVPPSTTLGCQSNTAIYKPRSWQADGESGRGSQRANTFFIGKLTEENRTYLLRCLQMTYRTLINHDMYRVECNQHDLKTLSSFTDLHVVPNLYDVFGVWLPQSSFTVILYGCVQFMQLK